MPLFYMLPTYALEEVCYYASVTREHLTPDVVSYNRRGVPRVYQDQPLRPRLAQPWRGTYVSRQALNLEDQCLRCQPQDLQCHGTD